MVNLSTRGGTTEAADLALKGSPDNIRWVHCLITVRGPDPSLTTDTPGVIEGVMLTSPNASEPSKPLTTVPSTTP